MVRVSRSLAFATALAIFTASVAVSAHAAPAGLRSFCADRPARRPHLAFLTPATSSSRSAWSTTVASTRTAREPTPTLLVHPSCALASRNALKSKSDGRRGPSSGRGTSPAPIDTPASATWSLAFVQRSPTRTAAAQPSPFAPLSPRPRPRTTWGLEVGKAG